MIEIELSKPVIMGDKSITKLTLREPKLGDLVGVDMGDQIGLISRIIQRCGDLPKSTVEQVSFNDIPKIAEKIEDFLD